MYGTADNPHDNEELVGAALRPYRDKIILATKFGVRFDRSNTSVNKPLSGFQTISDTQICGRIADASWNRSYRSLLSAPPDPDVPVEEVASVMSELIQEGKITHWGLSESTEDLIRMAHAVCPVKAIQNRYYMMARWHENLFPVLEELQIGYVAFSPLANGFLSAQYGRDSVFDGVNDYRIMMPQFTSEGIDKNQELLSLLQAIAAEKQVTPAQISLAWMLCKKPYIVPIPGTRKRSRLTENGKAANIMLTEQEVAELDRALDEMEISEVFGGTKIKEKEKV